MSEWKIGEIREIGGKKIKLIEPEDGCICDGCIYDRDGDECIDNGAVDICTSYLNYRWGVKSGDVIFIEVKDES